MMQHPGLHKEAGLCNQKAGLLLGLLKIIHHPNLEAAGLWQLLGLQKRAPLSPGCKW